MLDVRRTLSVLVCVAAVWAAACGGSPTQPTPAGPSQEIPPIAGKSSQPPARPLRKTTFVSFGDSITAGTVTTLDGLLRLVIAPVSYPYKLQRDLASRHVGQRIQVYNEGVAGECTGPVGQGCESSGLSRMPGVLHADSPQVLLLLEGVNDLNEFGSDGIQPTIDNLRSMIEQARAAGASVLVGTLLPQRPGAKRAHAPEAIQPFNDQLKAMAAASGATLVDLYTPFAADMSLIGPDGLHPTAAGYTKLAEIWADAIDDELSIPLPK